MKKKIFLALILTISFLGFTRDSFAWGTDNACVLTENTTSYLVNCTNTLASYALFNASGGNGLISNGGQGEQSILKSSLISGNSYNIIMRAATTLGYDWEHNTFNDFSSLSSLYADSFTVSNTPIYGCMDSSATNYNSSATVSDNSCTYAIYGCMDSSATNYNSSATVSDDSCTYNPVILNPITSAWDGNIYTPHYGQVINATIIDGIVQRDTLPSYGCAVQHGNIAFTPAIGKISSVNIIKGTLTSSTIPDYSTNSSLDSSVRTLVPYDGHYNNGIDNCKNITQFDTYNLIDKLKSLSVPSGNYAFILGFDNGKNGLAWQINSSYNYIINFTYNEENETIVSIPAGGGEINDIYNANYEVIGYNGITEINDLYKYEGLDFTNSINFKIHGNNPLNQFDNYKIQVFENGMLLNKTLSGELNFSCADCNFFDFSISQFGYDFIDGKTYTFKFILDGSLYNPVTTLYTIGYNVIPNEVTNADLKSDCESDIFCTIINNLNWLFIPNQKSLDSFKNLDLKNRIPFSYVYDMGKLYEEAFPTEPKNINISIAFGSFGNITLLSTEKLQAVPFQSLIRTVLGAIMLFGLAMWTYKTIIRLFNTQDVEEIERTRN